MAGDGVTCTFAANYDETSYDVVPLVTSFTRREHNCRLRGILISFINHICWGAVSSPIVCLFACLSDFSTVTRKQRLGSHKI